MRARTHPDIYAWSYPDWYPQLRFQLDSGRIRKMETVMKSMNESSLI
eukprot:gene26260-biopygen15362